MDLKVPSFMNVAGLGTDFSSMAGLGGLCSTDFSGNIDFAAIARMLCPQGYTPSCQPTASAQMKPEEREAKIKEIDKKVEVAKAEIKKEETKQTEKTDEKKEIEKQSQKYGVWDGIKSFGKGAAGIVADMFSTKDEKGERHFSPGKTALTAVVAAGAVLLAPLTLFTVGATAVSVGTVLAVGGAAMSAWQVGKGIYDATKAKTYADKDAAAQEISQGFVGGILSAVGFKGANALKAAKTAKAAEGLAGATEGLATAAEGVKATKTVNATAALGEVLHNNPQIADVVAKNADLTAALTAALKDGNKTNLANLQTALTNANIKDADQVTKIMQAVQAGGNTKDAVLIHKVDTEIAKIASPKTDLSTQESAKQKLNDLLSLTEEDGISKEVVAELAKVKASPQYGQLVGASGNKAALAAKGRMIKGIENEDEILTALKDLTNVSDTDKPIIQEAIAILEQLKKTGAGKEQVKTALGKLMGDEVLPNEGMLKADVAEAIRILKPTLKDRAYSAADHTKEGVFFLGRTGKKVVTHPFTDSKDFGLDVLNAGNFFAQASNQANEFVRQDAQTETLTALDDAIKAQKGKVTEAKNALSEKIKEQAEAFGVSLHDDNWAPKSEEQLVNEIEKARAKADADKKAKAAAEKAKEDAKAAK